MDFQFYSSGRADCLAVVYVNCARYHVHRMAGKRRAAYVMVRVTSGPSINQSEWMVPGTIEIDA